MLRTFLFELSIDQKIRSASFHTEKIGKKITADEKVDGSQRETARINWTTGTLYYTCTLPEESVQVKV